MHWASSPATEGGGRRPVSADVARLPAAAHTAEPSAGPPADGLAGALLDAARTALNKERAMRQRVRSVNSVRAGGKEKGSCSAI